MFCATVVETAKVMQSSAEDSKLPVCPAFIWKIDLLLVLLFCVSELPIGKNPYLFERNGINDVQTSLAVRLVLYICGICLNVSEVASAKILLCIPACKHELPD